MLSITVDGSANCYFFHSLNPSTNDLDHPTSGCHMKWLKGGGGSFQKKIPLIAGFLISSC